MKYLRIKMNIITLDQPHNLDLIYLMKIVSRAATFSEVELVTKISDSSEKIINENKLVIIR